MFWLGRDFKGHLVQPRACEGVNCCVLMALPSWRPAPMSYLSLCFLYLHANQISWCQETDHSLLALECTLFPPYLFIPVKPLPALPWFFYLALFLPFHFHSLTLAHRFSPWDSCWVLTSSLNNRVNPVPCCTAGCSLCSAVSLPVLLHQAFLALDTLCSAYAVLSWILFNVQK